MDFFGGDGAGDSVYPPPGSAGESMHGFAAQGPVQEDYLNATSPPFIQEQDLIGVVAGYGSGEWT